MLHKQILTLALLDFMISKGISMIDYKYQKFLFGFFMSLSMSCVMSFVISMFNVGLVSNFIPIWLSAWAFAFVVAFPTIIIVTPIAHKLVNLVLKKTPSDT